MSQNTLADMIGISNNHMSNIERGRESPSLDVLISICNALQVTPDYLFMGTLHPRGVPQNLIDSLSLCSNEDILLLEQIVYHMVERRADKWNGDNYI